MGEKWEAMTVRFSAEEKARLELGALITKASMNDIIREATRRYLKTVADLDQVKAAVASARSRGPRSLEDALEMAERAAIMDDSEGLGEVRAVVSEGELSERSATNTDTAATPESAAKAEDGEDASWVRDLRRKMKQQRDSE